MALGVARLDTPPGQLTGQLTKAHEEAIKALAELRELIHGIHPKVLTDYGLEAAVADAAARCVVPVDVTVLAGALCGEAPSGASAKTRWATTRTTANLPDAVRENEEVVPVNAVSTWVLPSGVTVGR